MSSYFNFKIDQFIIESLDGKKSIDATSCIASIKYYEDLFSPSIFISMLVVNTSGLISSLPILGGERVRLKITQTATDKSINIDETKNIYYIYHVYSSSVNSTRETFLIDLAPIEMFKNETTRVFDRYPETQGKEEEISKSVTKILRTVLKTDKPINVDSTQNSYAFYGNSKKPFTVLTWLGPKSIPTIGKSSEREGTAGFLFYQNKDGYHFKSVDSLMSGLDSNSSDRKIAATYYYSENNDEPASTDTNFKVLLTPVFEKNVNVIENLRVGMYSSLNYFFDLNTKKFNSYTYKLSESYDIMKHASKSTSRPKIPMGLENNPSRLMVKFIDDVVKKPRDEDPSRNMDDRIRYQSQSIARYNLAFTQSLNITIPLNLNLSVGDVIRLNIGDVTKEIKQKDSKRSGLYLIKELAHEFSGDDGNGKTGLKLIRDSYGEP